MGGSKLRQLLSCKQNFRGKGNILEDRRKNPYDGVKIHGKQCIKKPHTNKLRNFAMGSAFCEGELNPRQKTKISPDSRVRRHSSISPVAFQNCKNQCLLSASFSSFVGAEMSVMWGTDNL